MSGFLNKAAVPVAVAAALTMAAQAQQPAAFERLAVRGQVSLLTDGAANTLVQAGPQGVLVVDTQAEALGDRLLAEVRALAGTRAIRYVINTSADPDHTGGNLKIASSGAQLVGGNFAAQLGPFGAGAAFIVAHEKALHRLSGVTPGQPVSPSGGWPTDTFFQTEKTMYFNGEGIQLIHQPASHTDSDIVVFFRSSDVIAAGDVYDTTGFPRIDTARGGSVAGVIEALNDLIDLAISEQFTEGGTRIVPGHGRISDEFDVVEYRDMVTIVRDRVQGMVKRGMTVEQVKAARPAFDWEPRYGTVAGATAAFVESVYRSLK